MHCKVVQGSGEKVGEKLRASSISKVGEKLRGSAINKVGEKLRRSAINKVVEKLRRSAIDRVGEKLMRSASSQWHRLVDAQAASASLASSMPTGEIIDCESCIGHLGSEGVV